MKALVLKAILSMIVAAVVLAIASPPAPAAMFQSDSGAKTRDDQANNKADVNLTAKIRKAIVDDKTLSTAAHNVKLLSRDGSVTLRGEVNSAAEKDAIVGKSREIVKKHSSVWNLPE